MQRNVTYSHLADPFPDGFSIYVLIALKGKSWSEGLLANNCWLCCDSIAGSSTWMRELLEGGGLSCLEGDIKIYSSTSVCQAGREEDATDWWSDSGKGDSNCGAW